MFEIFFNDLPALYLLRDFFNDFFDVIKLFNLLPNFYLNLTNLFLVL